MNDRTQFHLRSADRWPICPLATQTGVLNVPTPPTFDMLILWLLCARCRVLVSYVYLAQDTRDPAFANLEYFLARGVSFDPYVDFIITVIDGSPVTPTLNATSLKNVVVERTSNRGSDLCTHYHVTQSLATAYDYFVFLNSGSRGPMLINPTGPSGWLAPFVNKLSQQVVLVGSMISCEISPHVQSWFMVANARGLEIVGETWDACPWSNHRQTILAGEIGLSRRILLHNLSIASQQAEYSARFGSCGALTNPTFASYDVYRHVFVKYGGEVWRQHKLHPDLVAQVEADAMRFGR